MVNHELELARHFVEKTNRNIFITGKAGTGKTTFLRNLQNSLNKRMVVVAPTGVAAINARGVTIHSFFQLPFGVLLPNSTSTIQRKVNRQKRDIIRSLDLVIIDEISMVRADILDAIDEVLRRYKDRHKVFGGVQMLFIGDLQQLSPVVRPNDWELLKQHYKNAYFFSSLAYQQANVIPIELKYIYRQQNENFIKILNEIRNNCLSDKSAEILNKQYQPNFNTKEDGYITLTTHNNRADKINQEKINELDTKPKTYRAIVSGNFPENSYPIDKELTFKVGSQVMFVKNDPSFEKRYFNGKIGTIVELNSEIISVQCDDEIIEASFETWENMKYSLNEETQEITEVVEGTFTQIPLRLAWAITIHKSQGLTFDKAIIDAEASFAHGQTYVALSRCKTLEGIVLKSKIGSSSIVNDVTVNAFNKEMEENQPDENDLKASKKQYQLDLINELFDFSSFLYPLNRLIDLFNRNETILKGNLIEPLQKIKEQGIIPLIKISNGFKNQLIELSKEIENPQDNDLIQERFRKAVAYFKAETETKITTNFDTLSYSTDNKTVEKDITRMVDIFEDLLRVKTLLFTNLTSDFSVEKFLKIRAKAVLEKAEKPKRKRKEVITTEHQELFEKLKLLREDLATQKGVGANAIFMQKTMFELCEMLPEDKKQLKKIHGLGKVRIEKYGDEILEIINHYAREKGLQSQVELIEIEREKKPKGSSKLHSLELFKQGLTIENIAKERGLAISTIESHLAQCISAGTLEIEKVIPKEKLKKGLKLIKENSFEGLTELKEIAGNEFSYSELRMLVNSVNKLEK